MIIQYKDETVEAIVFYDSILFVNEYGLRYDTLETFNISSEFHDLIQDDWDFIKQCIFDEMDCIL